MGLLVVNHSIDEHELYYLRLVLKLGVLLFVVAYSFVSAQVAEV